jgi:hypothetical protein
MVFSNPVISGKQMNWNCYQMPINRILEQFFNINITGKSFSGKTPVTLL